MGAEPVGRDNFDFDFVLGPAEDSSKGMKRWRVNTIVYLKLLVEGVPAVVEGVSLIREARQRV